MRFSERQVVRDREASKTEKRKGENMRIDQRAPRNTDVNRRRIAENFGFRIVPFKTSGSATCSASVRGDIGVSRGKTGYAVVVAAALGLSGCASTSTGTMEPISAIRSGSVADENACLAAVAKQTNASGVVLSSDFSQAATIVMVGVAPDRAPRRCLVSGGRVSEVMFYGSEGRL
jgi:hypothetical protein